MNALVAKEIRLLVPSYGMALLGAALAGWMMPDHQWGVSPMALLPLCFGAALLALSTFGREFSLNTFAAFLTQPVQRPIVWRAKLNALVLAQVTIILVWIAVGLWSAQSAGVAVRVLYTPLAVGIMATGVMFAGGLWTTLLLRQVAAAFWLTVLAPVALLMVVAILGGGEAWAYAVLIAYTVLSVWWAARYFQRLQEVPWTGAVVAFPGWRSRQAAASSNARRQQPFAALFRKEVRLHQLGMVGIASLFLLHLVVIFLRKAGQAAFADSVRSVLEAFGGVWLLVPFLVSAQTVAEERRMGTADALTCLPLSMRTQFWLKLGFVLMLGGLVCPVLLWIAELLGLGIGAGANIGGVAMSGTPRLLGLGILLFLGLSLCGFYGSSLARNVIQALAAGMVTVIVLWMLAVSGLHLRLLWYVGLPVFAPALLYLSWRNFARPAETGRFLMRNCVGAPATLAFVLLLTFGLYSRVWEFVMPLEPAHGPARFSLTNALALKSFGGSAVVAVLPDRQLWQQRISYNPGRILLGIGSENTGFAAGGRWVRLAPQDALVAGSNWVQAVANASEMVAIRSDGSLWVSERPVEAWEVFSTLNRYPTQAQPPAPLARFGADTGWKQVARCTWADGMSVVLLRDDGSLWRWGWATRSEKLAQPESGLRNSAPQRVGAEADWERMTGGSSSIYLWKKDGSAWVLHAPDRPSGKNPAQLEPEMVIERCQVFDHVRWRGLAQLWPLQLAVWEDGTLWAWYIKRPNDRGYGNSFHIGQPVQLGSDKDWVNVATSWPRIATLKADGSLWEWDLPRRGYTENLLESGALGAQPPRQLGAHKDWVAVAGLMEGIVSVAADGTVWYWWGRNDYRSSQPMLKSSRRPEVIAEINPR
jgi:hypothetical protein